MKDWFEKHKLVRRLALLWACSILTVFILRVSELEVLLTLAYFSGGAFGVMVTAVIGILTAVIGLYQIGRQKDKEDEMDK